MAMQVHYLGNAGRGTVWEEIIINCPSHIQLLGMSATVANPDDLGSWITKVCWTVKLFTCTLIWTETGRDSFCCLQQYTHGICDVP